MSLNWKEIDLILSELPLAGSHIQKIEQPDFSSLVLHCYSPGNRFALLVSLAQGKTRLHMINGKRTRNVALQRFAQLLRSRINGGRITEAAQLGSERIVRVAVNRGGEETILFIRLWGGAGNILACGPDGLILDAFYRRPGRKEVSGERFVPDLGGSGPGKEYHVRPFSCDGEDFPFNRAIEDEYSRAEQAEKRASLEKQALHLLEKRTSHLEDSLSRLREQLQVSVESEKFRQYGDLIMSNRHLVSDGSPKLRCANYYRDNELVEIPLDPALSVTENGEAYFNRYKKEKRKREYLEQDIANISARLERYADFRETMEEARDDEGILRQLEDFLSEEKSSAGAVQRTPSDESAGLRFYSGGFTILAGRSAKENDEMLRTLVKGNDYWLHTRDYPGGYVFIKNRPGKTVPLEVLLDAGNLALFFSKGRTGGKGELYYTQVKHLRRAKHGKTGTVIPTMEKNLSIVLDQSRIDRLLGRKERS